MPSATTSSYLHTKQMDYIFKGTSWTPPATLYVALFTTLPALTGSGGVEVTSGVNYARISITNTGWAGPSAEPNLEYSNIADITFGVPSGNWGTIVGAGLYDASSSGNLFYIAALTTSKTVNSGDGAPKILAGQLRVSRASC